MSRLLSLAAVLLLILPRAAVGQPAADLELAKRHFELARTYYDQADYEQALKAFKESYRLSKKPALLFNIGKCYEAIQHLHEAIDYYQRFLRDSGKQDPNLSARIRNLRRRLEPAPEPKPVEPGPTSRPAELAPPTSKKLVEPKEPIDRPPEETVSTTDTSESGWMKWAGWGLAGTGVVSIASSVVLGIFAARKANAVEGYWADGDRNWSEVKTFEDQGEALEIGQIVTLVVGIAAAAGGTTLLILSWKKQRSQSVSMAPTVTPTGVGFAGTLRF